MSLHQDIKNSTFAHFEFLKELGFSKFEEEQLAYEIHFYCHRENVRFDVCYEMIHSTPIWITLNGMDVSVLDVDNKTILSILAEKEGLYHANFQDYLKTDDTQFLKKNHELYEQKGKELNDRYINEMATILNKNRGVLLGDLTKLKAALKHRSRVEENEKREFSKANGIYSCEYNWNGLICEHEGTFEEINEHLIEREEMDLTDIMIFDWDGNQIERK